MSSHLANSLERWEFLTLKGDELYYVGQYRKAAKQFYQSVSLVESLATLPGRFLPTYLRCFVIGCHNLAACYARLENARETEYYYHYAMRHLQQLCEDSSGACRYQRARVMELDYARSKYMDYLNRCMRRQAEDSAIYPSSRAPIKPFSDSSSQCADTLNSASTPLGFGSKKVKRLKDIFYLRAI